jgi:hypothetical protein
MVSTSLTINMNALILTEVFPSDLFVWMQDKRLLSNKKGMDKTKNWIKEMHQRFALLCDLVTSVPNKLQLFCNAKIALFGLCATFVMTLIHG